MGDLFKSLFSLAFQGAAGHQGAVGSPGPAGPRVSVVEARQKVPVLKCLHCRNVF